MRSNLYTRYAPLARVDELFYNYQQFLDTMNDTLDVMGETKFDGKAIFTEKSFKWFCRTYGDFETNYTDLIAGRNEASMFLASRYKQFLEKMNLYNMTFDELNAMNNQQVSEYQGTNANINPNNDDDMQNVGIRAVRVMNSKQISLAIAKTNWIHPWSIMIQNWLGDIINVSQEPNPELYRR